MLRLLPFQSKQRFASSLGSSMIFRTKAGAACDFAFVVSSMSWHGCMM
jgi:hypothetical protein